ncbi:hypothetical protein SNOG_11742 [Parastagonospora nodorum SN15]|uniref:Inosine/uridine-preferring nucleoside hydrolase domain-containing protein n=1 Tax=Phaeosphaeria nodorum (strain SN15 / ATCC MYA-4574 / FGSC 10173) TaxID=321614 RepID=Q0U922_PHANO|nr:hypothetical protein SNOG_11742 [Parastagonospora nodorum SN15]EAT80786.2 hypothetical protein SNOG_11742 [Parastagonospora nodorum SN15]
MVHELLRAYKIGLTLSGESGLDGVTLLPQPIEPAVTGVNYLEAMYKALISTPLDTAWLVSTGTLTNIGLLFQKYPDLAGHLKGLSIMGGAVGGGFTNAPMGKVKGEGERFGNWTAYAEFNVMRPRSLALHLLASRPQVQDLADSTRSESSGSGDKGSSPYAALWLREVNRCFHKAHTLCSPSTVHANHVIFRGYICRGILNHGRATAARSACGICRHLP